MFAKLAPKLLKNLIRKLTQQFSTRLNRDCIGEWSKVKIYYD